MKIIHCLNYFLPGNVAGTEVYVMALMNGLRHRGIHSKVLIPNLGKSVNESYKIEGFDILQYAEPSRVDRDLQMGMKIPDGLEHFGQLIEQEAPDIIHFHELAGSNGIGLEHVKLAKKKRFPILMTFHLSAYTCKTGTLMYKEKTFCDGLIREKQCSECWYQHKGVEGWRAFVLSKASSFFHLFKLDISFIPSSVATALSLPHLIRRLRQNFDELVEHCDKLVVLTEWYKNILILNGVPEAKISYVKQGLPYSSTTLPSDRQFQITLPIRIIFLGRITPFKGLHLLVDALIKLPVTKVELDIYGQEGVDKYEHDLRNKTSAIANIRWKGRLAQQDVVNTMQQYDILCLCSTFSEMSPLVIQEAFVAGIPILASNVHGNSEQIRDGENGWLFKFNDVADLQSKIQMLIDNPDLIKRTSKCMHPVRSFDTVAAEYCDLYRDLLSSLAPLATV